MERSMMTIGNAPTPPCHGQQWASINTTSGTRSNSTSKISSSVKLDIASSAVDSSIDDHPDDMLSIRLPSITPAFSSSAASAAAVAASHPSVASLPRISGRFGPYGGRFVGESLIHGLSELERCAVALLHDPAFLADLATLRRDYSGRPTPLCHLPNLSRHYGGGVDIFLKREDLNHTSSHCINAALGHALLAKRMGKRRLVAASGSGHHAAAVAAAAARMGMGAVVYVGERDMGRVPEHVKEALGTAEVAAEGVRLVEVRGGCGGLKDATTEAIREMLSDGEAGEAYLVLPSAIGPHPMPWLAREMQKVVGEEARAQFLARSGGHLPAAVLACVGGGANSLGIFHPFLSDTSVRLIGIQSAGPNIDNHASPIIHGDLGVFHGAMSYLLQDSYGQTLDKCSIAPGLNYPLVGPEHGFLKDENKVEYYCIIDEHALHAFHRLAKLEGILPALETSHALAYLDILCPKLEHNSKIIVNCSGSGDGYSFI